MTSYDIVVDDTLAAEMEARTLQRIKSEWTPQLEKVCAGFEDEMRPYCELLDEQIMEFQKKKAVLFATLAQVEGERRARKVFEESFDGMMPTSLRRLLVLAGINSTPVPEAPVAAPQPVTPPLMTPTLTPPAFTTPASMAPQPATASTAAGSAANDLHKADPIWKRIEKSLLERQTPRATSTPPTTTSTLASSSPASNGIAKQTNRQANIQTYMAAKATTPPIQAAQATQATQAAPFARANYGDQSDGSGPTLISASTPTTPATCPPPSARGPLMSSYFTANSSSLFSTPNTRAEANMQSLLTYFPAYKASVPHPPQPPPPPAEQPKTDPKNFLKPKSAPVGTWEIDGTEFVFRYPLFGPGWFVLRCSRGMDLAAVTFESSPLRGGAGLRHFNESPCKYHDRKQTYTEKSMMVAFAHRVIDEGGEDVTDEWASDSNEYLQKKISKRAKPVGRAKGKPKIRRQHSSMDYEEEESPSTESSMMTDGTDDFLGYIVKTEKGV